MAKQPEGTVALNIKLARSEWERYEVEAKERGTYPISRIKDHIQLGLDTVEVTGVKPPLLYEEVDLVPVTSGKGRTRNAAMVTKPYWLPEEQAARLQTLARETGWPITRLSRSLMTLGERVSEQAVREAQKVVVRGMVGAGR